MRKPSSVRTSNQAKRQGGLAKAKRTAPKKREGKRRAAQTKDRRPSRARPQALPTKKLGFKFTGSWDEWGALVDDSDELESPNDSRNLPPGDHALSWSLTGEPGASYTVSIAGCSPKDWSREFRIGGDGRGIGSHPFAVVLP